MSEFGRTSDRISGSRLIIEQAKKPQKVPSRTERWRARFRALGLAGATTAVVAGGVVALNEYDKRAVPDATMEDLQRHGEIAGIDTSSILIQPRLEGRSTRLQIRMGPDNKATNFDPEKIRQINGTPWNGETPIVLKYTPIEMGIDPDTGIGQAPWLVVNLQTQTLMGDLVDTIGFISGSGATEGYVSTLKEGDFAQPSLDSEGNLMGTLSSGKEIPAERIAQAHPYVPTPEASPQS